MSPNQLPFDTPSPGRKGNMPEFSVTELSSAIRRVVEDGFSRVRLRGEVSGYRGPHGSGHCYFSIKDSKARIDAIIWKGAFAKMRVRPEEGMEVIVTGKVTTWPGKSGYQIVIEQLEAAGIGALLAQLEERRKRLEQEGLFDPECKKPLPFLPRTVGIVTSPTGAVIRDMLHGFEERFPVRVLVWPVRVQGQTCGAEVAAGVNGFNALEDGGTVPRPDILIVARGGGSLEDLWGFNDEVVVRAVADSAIPVISAVGHETDWTLVDHAADARAPTPTKAAEWAVPKYGDLLEKQADFARRLDLSVQRILETKRVRFLAAKRGLPNLQDLVGMARQRLDAASSRLGSALKISTAGNRAALSALSGRLSLRLVSQRNERCRQLLDGLSRRTGLVLVMLTKRKRASLDQTARGLAGHLPRRKIQLCRQRLDTNSKLLHTLSHHSGLARGFAMVTDSGGKLVRTRAQLEAGDSIGLEFSDGSIGAVIGDLSGGGGDGRGDGGVSLPAKKKTVRKKRVNRRKKTETDTGQGSLF